MNKQIATPGVVHYYWMDLIRFLAAFAVLACHFRGAFFVEYSLLQPEQQTPWMFVFYSLTRLGHEAVLVFFVLSGFLVGGKAIERIHDNTFNFHGYAIDRAVRIMLPLVSAVTFAAVVNLIIGREIELPVLIGNIFSLQGIICNSYIETLWSLCYEVWFYILICAFGYSIVYAKRVKGYIGIAVLFLCFMIFTKLKAYYLFIWLLGAIGFLFVGKKSSLVMWGSGFALIFSGVFLQLTSGSNFGGIDAVIAREYIELVFGLTFCLFLIQIIQFPPRKRVGLKLNNIGSRLAAFSYTLYLTHVPLLRLLTYLGAPKCESVNAYSLSLYVAWLLLATATAYLFYLIFERNTRKVKGWIKGYLNIH